MKSESKEKTLESVNQTLLNIKEKVGRGETALDDMEKDVGKGEQNIREHEIKRKRIKKN